MKILETGPSFKAWANEDGTEIEIERHATTPRGAMKETMNLMADGVWIAYGLEEREDGSLYERWVKHS